jgi:hypothetical protein
MTIASFDIVFYTSIFILPGFLIKGIISHLTPVKKTSDGSYFLSCLAYSLVHCAIWSWAYALAQAAGVATVCYWLLLVAITLVGAIIISLVVSIVKQKQTLQKLAERLGYNTINPIPLAWDYIFSKQQANWVIVTLANGDKFYGLFSSESFASSESEEKDIFIEKLYTLNEKNIWVKVENSKGVYLPGNVIQSIEFLKGEQSHEQK